MEFHDRFEVWVGNVEIVREQGTPQLLPVEVFHSAAEFLHHVGGDANDLGGRAWAFLHVTNVVTRGQQVRLQLFGPDKSRMTSRADIGE